MFQLQSQHHCQPPSFTVPRDHHISPHPAIIVTVPSFQLLRVLEKWRDKGKKLFLSENVALKRIFKRNFILFFIIMDKIKMHTYI